METVRKTNNWIGIRSAREDLRLAAPALRCLFFLFLLVFYGTAGFAAAPEAVAFSPASGVSYTSQEVFVTAEFRDSDGAGDLTFMFLKINEEVPGTTACYISYHGGNQLLRLRNDDNTAWLSGSATPGSPVPPLENSQCILDIAETTVQQVGTDTIRLIANITFKHGFIGGTLPATKHVYLHASDQSGANTGWQDLGDWTVLAEDSPNQDPTAEVISPSLPASSYVDQDASIEVEYSDPNGWRDLRFLFLKINEDVSGDSACYVYYDPVTNLLRLRNDDNTAWLGGVAVGSAATVDNTQCVLDAEKTEVSTFGPDILRLRANVMFKSDFIAGGLPAAKSVYVHTSDVLGNNSGWINSGLWTILAPAGPSAPTLGDVTPILPAFAVIGEPRDLAMEFKDVNGAQDIRGASLIINDTLSGADSTYVFYNRTVDQLFLGNDDDTGWQGPGLVPGTPGASVENSQVKLDVEKSSVEWSGDTMTLRLNLTFKSGFEGEKNVYLTTYDQSLTSNPGGWTDMGKLTLEDALAVCLMADPQFGVNPNTVERATIAMDDLENLPHSALFVLGDLAQQCEYWPDYRLYLEPRAQTPLFPISGNSDLHCGLDRYQYETGSPLWYSTTIRGIRFIMLSTLSVSGPTDHICSMGNPMGGGPMGGPQMTWLANELAADTQTTTVIFFHAPIVNTTYGSGDNYDPEKYPFNHYMLESEQVRTLLLSHPNVVVYASGHLHLTYGDTDRKNLGHEHLENGVQHLSVGATAGNKGSSCLFVHGDKIISRVRDHEEEKWDDIYDVIHSVTTTLLPASP